MKILALIAIAVLVFASYLIDERLDRDAAAPMPGETPNAAYLRTERYDGHLFIMVKDDQYGYGPQGLVHHPGCPCMRQYRIPDPSILEHMQGRQHLPNNGGILER